MLIENIVPQSAGSLAVAILGLLMVILQVLFRLKSPYFKWVAWSAAVSFSGMLYAVGVFLEYNTPPGSLCRFAGILEWVALILLVHAAYGLTFSYFGLNGKYYHVAAGLFHGLILIALCFTDYLVDQQFVSIGFMWLSTPFTEPALGPLGFWFELYAALAFIAVLLFWVFHKGPDPGYRLAYIIGIGTWIAFGFHDALASMGMPTVQYFMEYGYFIFSTAVFWVLFSTFADVSGEEKYRVIAEFANDGIVIMQDGKIVFLNPAAAGLFETEIRDFSFEALVRLAVKEDQPALIEHYERLMKTGEFPGAFMARHRRDNGEMRFIEIRASLIRYRNRPAALGMLRDMTKKIREEEALRESNEKIFRLKKMESMGLLAGGVAHDLNNVLSGVVNYPELILMNLPRESPLRKPVETIMKSGLKAVAIVQDLLTMARGVAIEKRAVNLNQAVREYLISPEHQKLLHFHPTVTVCTELAPDLLEVMGSSVHIGKVVMNLVSNASEAIEGQGRVLISTRNQYLDRPLKGYEEIDSGEYVVLSVSDSGPGISSDDLTRIFEPFFTKKVMGRSGTGLGLALVWNTMQDHGGYINVISSGEGTTFEMYFPVTREMSLKETSAVSLTELRGNGELILVVDDVESQREVSSRMLEALNYRTASAAGGEAALAYLKQQQVDLLLLDMVMAPGIDGLETYRQVLKIRPGQKAVIISGFSKTEDVVEMQKLGAGRYLKKPVHLADLGAAVKAVLGQK